MRLAKNLLVLINKQAKDVRRYVECWAEHNADIAQRHLVDRLVLDNAMQVPCQVLQQFFEAQQFAREYQSSQLVDPSQLPFACVV